MLNLRPRTTGQSLASGIGSNARRPGTEGSLDWPESAEASQALVSHLKKETDYLFSPRAVCERWNAEQIRKTGRKPGFVNLNKAKPPREHYDDKSYLEGRSIVGYN